MDCETGFPPGTQFHPDFHQALLATVPDYVRVDLDILFSQSFQDFGWTLTDPELDDLAIRIDQTAGDSPLGPDYDDWDLKLVFNYYTLGDTLYGQFMTPTIPPSQFFFYGQMLQDGYPNGERNHVDVYLRPLGLNSSGLPSVVENSIGCVSAPCGQLTSNCCYQPGGSFPSDFRDDDEDPPFASAEQLNGICPSSRGKCSGAPPDLMSFVDPRA